MSMNEQRKTELETEIRQRLVDAGFHDNLRPDIWADKFVTVVTEIIAEKLATYTHCAAVVADLQAAGAMLGLEDAVAPDPLSALEMQAKVLRALAERVTKRSKNG